MTGPSLILLPPRAFQISVFVEIPEHPLNDEQLVAYLQQQLSVSLALAPYVKRIAALRVANMPTGGPSQ